mgnify:CR=1 FL=1
MRALVGRRALWPTGHLSSAQSAGERPRRTPPRDHLARGSGVPDGSLEERSPPVFFEGEPIPPRLPAVRLSQRGHLSPSQALRLPVVQASGCIGSPISSPPPLRGVGGDEIRIRTGSPPEEIRGDSESLRTNAQISAPVRGDSRALSWAMAHGGSVSPPGLTEIPGALRIGVASVSQAPYRTSPRVRLG